MEVYKIGGLEVLKGVWISVMRIIGKSGVIRGH